MQHHSKYPASQLLKIKQNNQHSSSGTDSDPQLKATNMRPNLIITGEIWKAFILQNQHCLVAGRPNNQLHPRGYGHEMDEPLVLKIRQ